MSSIQVRVLSRRCVSEEPENRTNKFSELATSFGAIVTDGPTKGTKVVTLAEGSADQVLKALDEEGFSPRTLS